MYTIIKNGNEENYGVNYFIADSTNDLNQIIGAAPGSKAFVVGDKNYIKKPDGTWAEYISAIGNGSSGTVEDAIEFIGVIDTDFTEETINNPNVIRNGISFTAESGDIVCVNVPGATGGTKEYIWNGETWQWLDGGSGEAYTVVKVNGKIVDEFNADTKLNAKTEITTHDQLYQKNRDGSQTEIDIQNKGGDYIKGGIPRFSDGGIFATGIPTWGTAVANKNYVDQAISQRIYIGNEAPTDTLAQLWIDTDENYTLVNIEGVSF